MPVNAVYFDGKSSQGHAVDIVYQPQARLCIFGEGINLSFEIDTLDIPPALGNVGAVIRLPNDGLCEVANLQAFHALLKQSNTPWKGKTRHRFESHMGYTLVASLIGAIALWLLIEHGVPWMAKRVAMEIPLSAETHLGENALATLDDTLFSPSQLSQQQQEQVQTMLRRFIRDDKATQHYTIDFRYTKEIGANAFALPSGMIILTDDLVKLADNEQELISVFLHEVGHLRERHSLRHILQNSITVLLVSVITGDIASSASLAAVMPAMLLQAKFSRQFELEADQYAMHAMQENNIAIMHFENILKRLHKEGQQSTASVMDFLASHPALEERIERIHTE